MFRVSLHRVSCHALDPLTFHFLYVLWSVLPQGLCTSCALCPQGSSFTNLLSDSSLTSQLKYFCCRRRPLPT